MRTASIRRAYGIFAFLSFGAFAASMLTVLLFSAGAYKSIAEKSNESGRLCLSYIWSKVKTSGAAGSVYIEEFHGLSALCIYEEHDGILYKTAIYPYEGFVYELFSEANAELYPQDGTPVTEAETLGFESAENGLIKITVNSESMFIYPRSNLYVNNEQVSACRCSYFVVKAGGDSA